MPDTAPLLAAGAALCLLLPLGARPRLVWNATLSAPVGLYVLSQPGRLVVGDLVVATPPPGAARLAATRDYVPLGVPLLKKIVAVPGDPICATGQTMRGPRGLSLTRLRRDAKGRLLPWWQGCGRLGTASYLLAMQRVRDSFDGRYFGPVARGQIVGKARPLWLL